MREWFGNWRFFIFLYIICSSLWSVLAKFAASKLDPRTQTFVAVISASAIVAALAARDLRWQSGVGLAAALAAGILGGFASLAFYQALRQAPANVVIPLSSLYRC